MHRAVFKKLLKEAGSQKRTIQKEDEGMEETFKVKEFKKEFQKLKDENKKLEKMLADRMATPKTRDLEKKLLTLSEENQELKALLNVMGEKKEQLTMEVKWQKELTEQTKQEARKVISHVMALTSFSCNKSCPAFDLCKKRVLIVGGITRMKSAYRELIESSGGVFDYHDGYVKKGAKSLEYRMKRADMVLCPVNCNSHTACSVVKTLGKKHKKNVHMLPSYGLSTVSQVIRDAAAYGEENTTGTFGF